MWSSCMFSLSLLIFSCHGPMVFMIPTDSKLIVLITIWVEKNLLCDVLLKDCFSHLEKIVSKDSNRLFQPSQTISPGGVSWLHICEMSFFLGYRLARSRKTWCVIFSPLYLFRKIIGLFQGTLFLQTWSEQEKWPSSPVWFTLFPPLPCSFFPE